MLGRRDVGTGVYTRLSYQPALDGLRALAVGGVLLFHHDPGRVPGGWLGVSLFFTLSGFLIGSIALWERDRTQDVDVVAFWQRRIRRLMPASMIALAFAILVIFVNDIMSVRDAADDVRSAALQIANWHFIGADAPYAGLDASPSVVQHYWSLAIEEQFYLVFPLLMWVTARRPRLLVPILATVVTVGVTLQFVLDDLDRIYFGTDTRAPELAVGVGLALIAPRLRPWFEARPWVADAAGGVGLLSLAAMFISVELDLEFVTSGMLAGSSILWCALIVSALWGRGITALLALRPGPWIGRISYGIYLYHWPIYMLMSPRRLGFGGVPLLAVRLGLTLVAAVLSARFVEVPVRSRRGTTRATLTWAAAATATVVVAAMAVPSLQSDSTLVAFGGFTPPPVPVTAPVAPATSEPTVAGTSVDRDSPDDVPDSPDATGPAATGAVPAPTTQPPSRVPRLLVAGDSTANAVGLPLQRVATARGAAEVYVRNMPGCALLPYERAQIRRGYTYDPDCPDVAEEIVRIVRANDIDVVFLLIGSPQLMDLELAGLRGWHSIVERTVQDRYTAAAERAMDRLADIGVPVLWADVAIPDWNIDAFSDLVGVTLPGSGPAVTNDPARAMTLNRLDDAVASRFGHVARVPFVTTLADPSGVIPAAARADGLHLDQQYGATVVAPRLLPLLEQAYREVRVRPGGALVAAQGTTWDR